MPSHKKKPGKEKKLEGRGTGTLTRDWTRDKHGHPLKTPKDVDRIKFTLNEEGQPVQIGGRHYGKVFIGKISFKGEKQTRRKRGKDGRLREHKVRKWHRVAIKRFNDPERAYDGGPWYQETIEQLQRHYVSIPKMGMMKLAKGTVIDGEKLKHPEWVQVSQLYGSTKNGSKIHQKSWGHFPTKEGREFAVRELTKVCDAGRNPAYDLIEPIKLRRGTSTIPFDIDELHYERFADTRAMELVDSIHLMAKKPFEGKGGGEEKARKEHQRLLAIAMEEATPAMKKAITKAERHRIKIENM